MESIFDIFNQISENTLEDYHILELFEKYQEEKQIFIKCLQQIYLKIVKDLHKTSRKIIEKFENLTEKLFEYFYTISQKQNIFPFFFHFLSFFSLSLQSTSIQTLFFVSRQLLLILNPIQGNTLIQIVDFQLCKCLLVGTIGLLKENNSNLKLIGIKIYSYIQIVTEREDIRQLEECIYLKVNKNILIMFLKLFQNEVIKLVSSDQNEDVRKFSLMNIEMNKSSFLVQLERIGDRTLEIRRILIKKLIQEKIPLQNIPFQHLIKLIKQGIQQKELFLIYLTQNLQIFEGNLNFKKNIQQFLLLFQIEKHVMVGKYMKLLEKLMKVCLEHLFLKNDLEKYLQEQISILEKHENGHFLPITFEEIYFFRVILYSEELFKDTRIIEILKQVISKESIFEKIMYYFSYILPNLFAAHQCLQIIEYLIEKSKDLRQKYTHFLSSFLEKSDNLGLIISYGDECDEESIQNEIVCQVHWKDKIVFDENCFVQKIFLILIKVFAVFQYYFNIFLKLIENEKKLIFFIRNNQNLVEKYEFFQQKKEFFCLKCLKLIQVFLAYYQSQISEQNSEFLFDIIVQNLQSDREILIKNAFKCLSLFLLCENNPFKKFNNEHCLSLFKQMLSQNAVFGTISHIEIISLQTIIDYLLLSPSQDATLQQILIKYCFFGKLETKSIAVEGLIKLISFKKCSNMKQSFVWILLVLIDKNIKGSLNNLIVCFVYDFCKKHLRNRSFFEECLEILVVLVGQIIKKKYLFHTKVMSFQQENLKKYYQCVQMGLFLISSRAAEKEEIEKQEEDNLPQIRFFIFLVEKFEKNINYFKSILENILFQFDFFLNLSIQEQYSKYLTQYVLKCTNQFRFSNKIKEGLKKLNFANFQTETESCGEMIQIIDQNLKEHLKIKQYLFQNKIIIQKRRRKM